MPIPIYRQGSQKWKLTLDNFRQEVRGSFVLLYPVALHDLAVTVDTDIPSATRLGLPIEHRGVCDVVVLKHTLLELTLRSEVILEINMKRENGAEVHSH